MVFAGNLYSDCNCKCIGPLFTIPNNAAIGVYQQPAAVPPYYAPAGLATTIHVIVISPANATAGSLRGLSANVVGVATQPLGVGLNGATVAGSGTVYTGPSQSATPNATETLMYVLAPYAFTASQLCVTLRGAAPSGGAFTVTLRDAPTPGYTSADTALVATVPASGGIGTYCDTTHTVSVASGDAIDWKLVNGSGSTGPTIQGISMMTTIPGGKSGFVVFGLGGLTMANNSSLYYLPMAGGTAGSLTESTAGMPAPRSFTASNLSCYVTTAPLTDANTVTIRQNLASPSSGLTVSLALLATGFVQDNIHTISFSNKDVFDLLDNQVAGTAPAVSSCSMEID